MLGPLAGDSDKASVATWIGYLAMCLGMFMAILDIQIVASSLPDIQVALHIPEDRLSWLQTSYLIAEVIAIPLTGWLARLLSVEACLWRRLSGSPLPAWAAHRVSISHPC